ncbi:MAG: potassium-transporting ATPase subunit KdpC [Caulobacteraceae bacterium]|nr:potassium-transporting ATPase subunit KdpC [Caulobacteraceae bacterium]
MLQHVRPAVVMMALFTLLLGLAYPLAMTGAAGLLFPHEAGGSLVRDGSGQVIGSALLAQGFAKPEYLHPRPSAAGNGYDPTSSAGSNLGPMDQHLIDRVKGDAANLRKDAGGLPIPADAVTTSGSGLDPDISPANARMQAARIAEARGVPAAEVQALLDAHTVGALLGFIGEPRVNVFETNRALDARFPVAQPVVHPKA